MTTTATKTYQVSVIERALAFYEVEAQDARTAAENWQDGEYEGRDDEALDNEGPCNVREQQADGTWRKVPQSEWDAATPAVSPANKPYSVLLLYPDYANDRGDETYYAFVVASDQSEAVALAQREAVVALEEDGNVESQPDDFAPLLVTEGHHTSEPLFNK